LLSQAQDQHHKPHYCGNGKRHGHSPHEAPHFDAGLLQCIEALYYFLRLNILKRRFVTGNGIEQDREIFRPFIKPSKDSKDRIQLDCNACVFTAPLLHWTPSDFHAASESTSGWLSQSR
jgi:hypothetical protein